MITKRISFNFARLVNGIPCEQEGITVGIDRASGQLRSYMVNWYDAQYAPLTNIISPEKAREIYQAQEPFELAYVFPFPNPPAPGQAQSRTAHAGILQPGKEPRKCNWRRDVGMENRGSVSRSCGLFCRKWGCSGPVLAEWKWSAAGGGYQTGWADDQNAGVENISKGNRHSILQRRPGYRPGFYRHFWETTRMPKSCSRRLRRLFFPIGAISNLIKLWVGKIWRYGWLTVWVIRTWPQLRTGLKLLSKMQIK